MTKGHAVLIAITLLNATFALLTLSQVQPANAAAEAAPVLRARMLEIVDDRGRVRASIQVHPADAKVRMPDGKPQAESVVLRLINPNGRPGVKVASSENEVGFALIAEEGNYLQAFASGMKLTRDGRERAAWPQGR